MCANLSWDGTNTNLSNNWGYDGGAIGLTGSSLTWKDEGAYFGHNSAVYHGGAISVDWYSILFCGENSTFSNNNAGTDGGAFALTNIGGVFVGLVLSFSGGTFIGNSAAGQRGAAYMHQSVMVFYFESVTFQSNSASAGGCRFLGNTAKKTCGAVDSIFGFDDFSYSLFEGNSASKQP